MRYRFLRLIVPIAIGLSTAGSCGVANAMDVAALSRAVSHAEASLHARIGIAMIDTGDGATWSHNGDERFPMNSTYKAFACAAVLSRVDANTLNLDMMVPIDRARLVTYSPVTEKVQPGGALSLSGLCSAAVSVSDNTAGNLVLDAIGGPSGFTEFMRSIGDRATHLDRLEPELNEATPKDVRDTTTPHAAATDLRKLLLGHVLSAPSKRQLSQWMVGNKVTQGLLRAGFPSDWRVADKSGAGGHGSRSIIAIAWPPERAPIVVAIYITQTVAPMSRCDQTIAQLGEAIASAIQDRSTSTRK